MNGRSRKRKAKEPTNSLFIPVLSFFHHTRSRVRMMAMRDSDNINIVIPMAGEGKRFADAGYDVPKPFIEVAGKTMVERVIESLSLPGARYILVARTDHAVLARPAIERLSGDDRINLLMLDGSTEGAACTVMEALGAEYFGWPLLIVNADQLVDCSMSSMIEDANDRDLDGSIMVFRSDLDPKWSYARLGEDGYVDKVAEKTAISPFATTGHYYFKSAKEFIVSAQAMIDADDRVNGEFYICPVYNYLIKDGGRVGIYEIAAESMHDLGTPEDLKAYLKHLRD